MITIAINGFGRIGKNFLRCLLTDNEALRKIHVAAINLGPSPKESVAYAFKYDTLLGTYPGDVVLRGNDLHIGSLVIHIVTEKRAQQLPWKKLGIDWVVDCSGKFTQRNNAQQHIDVGARAVLISAPAQDEDVTIIPGINDAFFNKEKHQIVSLGSCTTNALVPLLHILDQEFKLERAFMTTIHAYTNSQVLLDVNGNDMRRSRAAALNIIPTTTGAEETVVKIMPKLLGKISSVAVRVPIDKVSLIDLVFECQQKLVPDMINEVFEYAASNYLKGIVACTEEPLVSSDFKGSIYSVVVDTLLTTAQEKSGKLFGWYDNEWGYSQRLKDFLLSQ